MSEHLGISSARILLDMFSQNALFTCDVSLLLVIFHPLTHTHTLCSLLKKSHLPMLYLELSPISLPLQNPIAMVPIPIKIVLNKNCLIIFNKCHEYFSLTLAKGQRKFPLLNSVLSWTNHKRFQTYSISVPSFRHMTFFPQEIPYTLNTMLF